MNKYSFLLFFLTPICLRSQETWNTIPALSFWYNEITDMFVHNDTIVVYGTSLYSQSNPEQGLVVAQLDTNGSIIKEVFIKDSMGDLLAVAERWGDIIKTSDGGYAATTAPYFRNSAILIKFDAHLNIDFIKEYVDTTLESNFWYNIREVKNGYLLFGIQQLLDLKIVGFVKYVDKQGAVNWEKQYSFSDYRTSLADLQLINDTSFVFVTNETIDPGSIGQIGSIRTGIYKINMTGDITASWQSEPTPPTGGLLNVIPLPGGDIITYGVARKGFVGNQELIQPVLTRFDTAFNIDWSYNFGKITSSGSRRHLQKFIRTVDGHFAGVGTWFAKTGTEPSRGHGWIYKFSAAGDSIWGRSFPTPLLPDEYPNGGILYGAGTLSSGNIMAGGYAEDGQNRFCWLVKVTNDGCMDTLYCQPVSSVSQPDSQPLQIDIYPIPASTHFNIQSPVAIKQITVFDVPGRRVLVRQNTGRSVRIDLPDDLPVGLYFVEIQTETGHIIWKQVYIGR